MSLAIKYESVEDATMRLRHTVVMYKGAPVYITDILNGTPDEIMRVYFDELPRGARDKNPEDGKRKFISSKHFDIAPFKLGYVNAPTGAFHCTRLPNRIQKQGLCGENFAASDNLGRRVDFATFLRTKEVVDMIYDNYPRFDVAVKALAKVPSVAFSRDFALMRDQVIPGLTFIYHKCEKVGAVMDGKAMLGDKFKCLQESLEEAGVKVAR